MADEQTKKKMGRPKQDVVKDKLVIIVMDDEEMERFELLERTMGKTKSELMREAFSAAIESRTRTLGIRKNHQVGVWLDPAETEKLEQLRGKLNTSKGGVFKYGLNLLYKNLQAKQEKNLEM